MSDNFAIKAMHAMIDSEAANAMGPYAFSLCCAVVVEQDAIDYSGPVLFFHNTLCDALGLNQRQLISARENAMRSGWLEYEPSMSGVSGRYSVTIPDIPPNTP
jgi:hypothetical protein